MINDVIKQHHKALDKLRQIQEIEKEIIVSSEWLDKKENPFYDTYKREQKQAIKDNSKKIEVLFTEHAQIIKELN